MHESLSQITLTSVTDQKKIFLRKKYAYNVIDIFSESSNECILFSNFFLYCGLKLSVQRGCTDNFRIIRTPTG